MNKCNKCGVNLENNVSFCPLCGSYNERENRDYPKTAFMRNDFTFGYKRKLLRFLDVLLLTGALVCSVIGLFLVLTGVNFFNWWYVYTMVAIIGTKFGVVDMLKKQHYNWRCILLNCIQGLAITCFLDWYSFGFNGFSLSYAAPGLTAACSIMVTIFCFSGKLNPLSAVQAFIILLLFSGGLVAFNMLMSAFTALKLTPAPSLISLAVAAVCFLTLFLFKFKDFTQAFLESFKTK